MAYWAFHWSSKYHRGDRFPSRCEGHKGRVYTIDSTGAVRCLNKPHSRRDRHRAEVRLRKMTKAQRADWEKSLK